MKALEVKCQIALKNILFATDFDVSANRALPFAVALADRYGAKLYAAHVIPGLEKRSNTPSTSPMLDSSAK
jgi:nucleotide-binding universal stress UspA family protein